MNQSIPAPATELMGPEPSDFDPDFVKDAVLGGHGWALDWEYQGISPDEDRDDVVEETAEILTMWRVIEQSIAELDAKDRAALESHVGAHAMRFNGFDGNNDPHHGVAWFMVEKMGRFDERKGRSMNSHSRASLSRYRSIRKRYLEVTENSHFDLSLEELKTILEPSKVSGTV